MNVYIKLKMLPYAQHSQLDNHDIHDSSYLRSF